MVKGHDHEIAKALETNLRAMGLQALYSRISSDPIEESFRFFNFILNLKNWVISLGFSGTFLIFNLHATGTSRFCITKVANRETSTRAHKI
jgi:hypothetical protein